MARRGHKKASFPLPHFDIENIVRNPKRKYEFDSPCSQCDGETAPRVEDAVHVPICLVMSRTLGHNQSLP